MSEELELKFEVRLRRGYNLHGREAWVEVGAGEAAVPEAVLRKGQRPAKSAVTMANALLFEHDLMTGRFKSVREARKAYGITRGVSQRFFKLLNLPPAQIEALLNKMY